jgi:hypothetical protein
MGGSSASKTYTIAQNSVINSLSEDNSTIVFRKESTTINDSVYADFKSIALSLNEYSNFFIIQDKKIITPSGKFRFRGLDDSEKIKGISQYLRVYFNELSQFDYNDWEEAQRRLRGRPNQKLIADWNPIDEQHWIKKELIDREEWADLSLELKGNRLSKLDESSYKRINDKGDTLLIKVSYKDNYWIVGSPCGEYGYVDRAAITNFERMRTANPNDYRIYALGEWGSYRTGGEFWKSFSVNSHVGNVSFMTEKTVHLAVDINRMPYIAQSLWQINGVEIRQFAELPAREPHNDATGAARLVSNFLDGLGYRDVVYLYGDASGNTRTAVDNRSFFGVYTEELKKRFRVDARIMHNNPSVSMSGEWINEIYAGNMPFNIRISDRCNESSIDYNTVKAAPDGTMLKQKVTDPKTGVSYEKAGHLSDAKRYFICKAFENEYRYFINRGRGAGTRAYTKKD